MSAEDAFQTLKTYFETRPAAQQALSALREGVEVSIVVGSHVDCALFRRGEKPVVENRPAVGPDVVFAIKPESVYVLASQPSEDVGDIGVAVIKEILAGNISVQIPGGALNVLRNGYLEIMSRGGARIYTFLDSQGLSSVSKIMNTIKSLRN